MDRQEYDLIMQKRNEAILHPDKRKKIGSEFALRLRAKLSKDEYKKSTYYENNKYAELARYFAFCYTTLCRLGIIDLPRKIKELNKTGQYDIDVITLLCIFKRIGEAYGLTRKKMRNYDLIILWGLLFDSKVQKENKRWKEDMRELLKQIEARKPSDYDNFFEKKDWKYLKHNSFQKYKVRLKSERLKVFMTTIFDVCEKLRPDLFGIYISQFFDVGFYIYVCNLKLEGLVKYKDLKYNYDVIERILSKSGDKKSKQKSKNARVLEYIYTHYTDIFYKTFLKK